jgi:hypothetical protein
MKHRRKVILMKKSMLPAKSPRAWSLCAIVALTTMGCVLDGHPRPSSVPVMPMPTPGTASLSGHVVDVDGRGVAGATLKVAETDATATTDPQGRYDLPVLSDSTLTLVTSAGGFATTYREPIMLASQSTVTGFDVLLLSMDKVTAYNALGPLGSRGVMALRLHSMSPTCVTAGARISIWPPKAGTVVYSRPASTGALDEPDPLLTQVQPGARVSAWLVGAISPGNSLLVTVQQSGCHVMTQPPSIGGAISVGMGHVDTQVFTEMDLFLEQGN